MALLGSVFILGKTSETASNIEGATGTFKVAVSSASPGRILAVLGTALLITTMVVQAPLTVNDRPVYLQSSGLIPSWMVLLPLTEAVAGGGNYGVDGLLNVFRRQALQTWELDVKFCSLAGSPAISQGVATSTVSNQ